MVRKGPSRSRSAPLSEGVDPPLGADRSSRWRPRAVVELGLGGDQDAASRSDGRRPSPASARRRAEAGLGARRPRAPAAHDLAKRSIATWRTCTQPSFEPKWAKRPLFESPSSVGEARSRDRPRRATGPGPRLSRMRSLSRSLAHDNSTTVRFRCQVERRTRSSSVAPAGAGHGVARAVMRLLGTSPRPPDPRRRGRRPVRGVVADEERHAAPVASPQAATASAAPPPVQLARAQLPDLLPAPAQRSAAAIRHGRLDRRKFPGSGQPPVDRDGEALGSTITPGSPDGALELRRGRRDAAATPSPAGAAAQGGDVEALLRVRDSAGRRARTSSRRSRRGASGTRANRPISSPTPCQHRPGGWRRSASRPVVSRNRRGCPAHRSRSRPSSSAEGGALSSPPPSRSSIFEVELR